MSQRLRREISAPALRNLCASAVKNSFSLAFNSLPRLEMHIAFRQISSDDFEFLWRLHNVALKEYVEKTWGWDAEWQRRNFEQSFNPNDGEIIIADGADAGFFWIVEKETETLLASIRLLPAFQKQGIGTKIIKNLLDESEKPVRLQVLKVNPARNLYQRLGFKIVGETDTHFLMRTQMRV